MSQDGKIETIPGMSERVNCILETSSAVAGRGGRPNGMVRLPHG